MLAHSALRRKLNVSIVYRAQLKRKAGFRSPDTSQTAPSAHTLLPACRPNCSHLKRSKLQIPSYQSTKVSPKPAALCRLSAMPRKQGYALGVTEHLGADLMGQRGRGWDRVTGFSQKCPRAPSLWLPLINWQGDIPSTVSKLIGKRKYSPAHFQVASETLGDSGHSRRVGLFGIV